MIIEHLIYRVPDIFILFTNEPAESGKNITQKTVVPTDEQSLSRMYVDVWLRFCYVLDVLIPGVQLRLLRA